MHFVVRQVQTRVYKAPTKKRVVHPEAPVPTTKRDW